MCFEVLKDIKIVVSDVDGVLTDGGLYYSADGMVMKKFNVKDGMGVVRLKKAGLLTGIISTDNSDIIKSRAERLKMDFAITGTWEKKSEMLKLCEKYNCTMKNVAFIGDDVNDLEIIKSVGFSAAPADAMPEITEIVDYVCKKSGGKGVFRELAELVLKNKES
ncbi:MAG: KdsC family phosphatase [Rhodothermaceae bacterium]